MRLTIAKPCITPRQKALALGVAGCADLLQIVFWPLLVEGLVSPAEDFLDLIVAGALILICGLRWQFIVAFLLEAVPGFDLFPTWTALVLSIPMARPDGRSFDALAGDSQGAKGKAGCGPIEITAVAVPPVQSGAGQNSR